MKTILTGDRPTGKLHLGHYVGSLLNRVKLQNIHKQFVMIADIQALTDNFENPSKVRDNIFEVIKDYIAVGIDPSKTTIFLQSQIKEIAELTIFYMNLVTVARLERNPTVKTEMKQKNMENSIPAGFLCYPISQAADITIVKADLVPVGEDQLPMIEQTNEIVRKFNRIYNVNCLKEAEAVLGNTKRLVGIDGAEKAGKSLGNAIYLCESSEILKKKVFSMYTDPNHLKVSDPGKIEGNVVFSYLDAFHANKEEIKELKTHYQKGGLGDMTIKKILLKSLEDIISPMREKRNKITNQEIFKILDHGITETRKIAKQTISEVYDAISIMKF